MSASGKAPIVPSSKANAVPPKVSGEDDNHVELDHLPQVKADEDIMQLARLGDVPGIQRLFDSGKFDIGYCDHEGITPLHVSVLSWLLVFRADQKQVGCH